MSARSSFGKLSGRSGSTRGLARASASVRAACARCRGVWPGVPDGPGRPPIRLAMSRRSTARERSSAVTSGRRPGRRATVIVPSTSLRPTRPATSVKRKRPSA